MKITTETNWCTRSSKYITEVKAIELSKEDEELGFRLEGGVQLMFRGRGVLSVSSLYVHSEKSLNACVERIRKEQRLAAQRKAKVPPKTTTYNICEGEIK